MIAKVSAKSLRVLEALSKYCGGRADYKQMAADLQMTYAALRKQMSVLMLDGLVIKTAPQCFEIAEKGVPFVRSARKPETPDVMTLPSGLAPSTFIRPISRERLMAGR